MIKAVLLMTVSRVLSEPDDQKLVKLFLDFRFRDIY
jgi:hypothetical protein